MLIIRPQKTITEDELEYTLSVIKFGASGAALTVGSVAFIKDVAEVQDIFSSMTGLLSLAFLGLVCFITYLLAIEYISYQVFRLNNFKLNEQVQPVMDLVLEDYSIISHTTIITITPENQKIISDYAMYFNRV